MSTEKAKDLSYYLANPEEMPTDPAEIERLAEQQMESAHAVASEELTLDRFVKPENAETAPAKDEKAESSPASEAKAEPEQKPEVKAEVKPETEVKPEVKPDGVLAKDGKNVIPYAVLATARERAEAAERLVRQQSEELAALKALSTKDATQKSPETEMLTDEDLSALAEDSPVLANVLRAQQEAIKKLTGTVETLTGKEQQAFEEQQAVQKQTIQEAIDSNSTLTEWQNSEDKTLWREAVRMDKALRESPAYRDVPYAQRFEKVVEMTRIAMGIPSPQVASPQNEVPVLSQEQIKAAAEAKLKGKPNNLPTSLSQIPGGAPPAVDEKGRVEQMSASELGNALLGMKSTEDILEYVRSL